MLVIKKKSGRIDPGAFWSGVFDGLTETQSLRAALILAVGHLTSSFTHTAGGLYAQLLISHPDLHLDMEKYMGPPPDELAPLIQASKEGSTTTMVGDGPKYVWLLTISEEGEQSHHIHASEEGAMEVLLEYVKNNWDLALPRAHPGQTGKIEDSFDPVEDYFSFMVDSEWWALEQLMVGP